MNKVISLMEILPIHRYKCKEETKKQAIRDTKWLENQAELGQKGENLVKKFLEENYHASVIVEPDYIGYDFTVKLQNRKFVVEVKTTIGNDKKFFISRNELLCAEKMKDLYYLYFLVIEKSKGKLYIINNPVDILKLEKRVFYNNVIDNEMVQAQIEGLIITIDDVQLEKFFATDKIEI